MSEAWKYQGHCAGIFGISCLFCSSQTCSGSPLWGTARAPGLTFPSSFHFIFLQFQHYLCLTSLRPQFEQRKKRNSNPIYKTKLTFEDKNRPEYQLCRPKLHLLHRLQQRSTLTCSSYGLFLLKY